jgi:hypothetical protein
MVIIVIGPPGSGHVVLGRVLASELRWPFVDAAVRGLAWQREVVTLVDRALDRRDHCVVASPELTFSDRERLGGRRLLRFVDLGSPQLTRPVPDDGALHLDAAKDPSILAAMIRRELGL